MNADLFLKKMLEITGETPGGIACDEKCDELKNEVDFITALAVGGNMEEFFRRRLKEAEKTENPHIRAGEIREIAEEMLKCGDTDGAFDLAKTIGDDYQREWMMIFVAGAMAEAGRIEEALDISEQIGDVDCRARALAAVGKGMRKTSCGLAAEVLNRASDTAERMKDPYDSLWVLCDIARAMPAGEGGARAAFDRAVDKVHYVCHTVKRASAFRALAEAMAAAGDGRAEKMLGLALESAQAVNDAAGKANALAWVAAAMNKAGNVRAVETLGNAVAAAQLIKDGEGRSRAFRWIAGALAESGDLLTALSLAGKIRHAFFRYEALKDIAATASNIREYEIAAAAVGLISDRGPRIETIKELVIIAVNKKME